MIRTTLVYFILLATSAHAVDFAHDVVPILKEYCGDCHLADKKKGGFSMNTRAGLLAGSENGEVLKLGDGAGSYLIEVLETEDTDIQMPPKGDLVPAEKIAILKAWLDEKAPWEPGFAFGKAAWEPSLKPRVVKLPAAANDRENPIDRLLDSYLAKNKIETPALVSNEIFLRRIFMDVLGVLPTEKERTNFLANPNREKLITDVLARDVDYAEHWLTFWNDLLRNAYAGTGFIDGGRTQITKWLYRSLVDNVSYDRFVNELISPPTTDSEGFIAGIKWRGTVNASQRRELQFSQNISQVFLGINMKCASCHDSFIDRWNLDEAYGLAAIVAEEPLEIHRCDVPQGKLAKAAWIFPEIGKIDAKADKKTRLAQLSKLMTHRENGRFTRTMVNRMWHRMMGRGIVHPVDAMHTEPWNEDLLDWLAENFVAQGYDLKKLIAQIANSAAYQSEVAPTPTVDELVNGYTYRGPIARRLTAEQFMDSVWTLTKTQPSGAFVKLPRYKVESGKFDDIQLTGKWIWSDTDDVPKANETITIRKKITLAKKPTTARAVVTADNSYTLWVNGRKLAEGNNWTQVEPVDLRSALKVGDNEIWIVAHNGGTTPNPAGAYFEADIDGKKIVTDESWNWSKRVPDKRGKFKKQVTNWASVKLQNSAVWQDKIADGARAGLAYVSLPVRASLMKCDLLMRSLGRPNREQVVTLRPEQLSTLQAIDLANGQILTTLLQQGAANLEPEFSDKDASAIIETLFARALSRAPSANEKAVLSELITAQKSRKEGIEDALWMVMMLPEFQLVR